MALKRAAGTSHHVPDYLANTAHLATFFFLPRLINFYVTLEPCDQELTIGSRQETTTF